MAEDSSPSDEQSQIESASLAPDLSLAQDDADAQE
jgi:hypothetical protein